MGVNRLSKLVEILERGFVCLVIHLSAQANIRFSSAVNYTQGNLAAQTLWFGIYAITFCLVAVRWKRFLRVATADKLLLLLVGIALTSIIWSVAPEVTLRRGVALAGTTFFGIYLATRYSPRELLRLVAWTLGIGAVLSLLCGLGLRNYAVMSGGLWRGVYMHKNALGRLMAVNAIVLLLLTFSNRKYRWITGIGCSLSVVLLLLSGSKTALVVFITLLLLLPLYRALRWKYTIAVPFFIFVLLVGGSAIVWLSNQMEIVLGLLGKDATLTGRTDIWDIAIEMINQRPLLGYGYAAFWLGSEGEYSAYVWSVVNWDPPNAHNGFLDLGLTLGYLGITVFLVGFLMTYIRAVTWARLNKSLEGLWPLEYMSFILISSQSESVILAYHDIYWIFYVAISIYTRTYNIRASKPVVLGVTAT